MADDLDFLTTPIAKGKSLAKKIRHDMSRESKKTRSLGENGRSYLYPEAGNSRVSYMSNVDEPLPLRVMGVDEPLPSDVAACEELMPRGTGVGRRRNRRSYKHSMYGDETDSVELRELNRSALSSMGGDEGEFINGQSSQHDMNQRPNQPGLNTKINRANVKPNRLSDISRQRQYGEMSMTTVRWSDQESSIFDNSERAGATLNRSNESSRFSDISITRGGRFFDRYHDTSQTRNNPNEPWTVYNSGRDTYFVYGTTIRANNPPEEQPGCCGWWDDMWAPYGGFRRITSPWIFASLSLLFVANIFFMTAFLTNYWGIVHILPRPGETAQQGHDLAPMHVATNKSLMTFNDTSYMQWIWNTWKGIPNPVYYETHVQPEVALPEVRSVMSEGSEKEVKHVVNRMNTDPQASAYWKFGLWQCCRNTDGLCLGPKFATFYAVTRSLSVLSLFFTVLSFAWMLGHTLEKLMDYDTCTMSTLISMCYVSSIFTTIAVIAFGVWWPIEFGEEYNGTDPELSYSFYLACFTIPLTVGAAICSTIDLKTGLDEIKANELFYSDPDNFSDVTMSDMPTDNISRPRHQKKKRTGQGQLPYVYETQA